MKTVPQLHHHRVAKPEFSDKKAMPGFLISNRIDNSWQQFMDLFHPTSMYRFLKVHTELMKEAGIEMNDMVVINPEAMPVTGKIVVVKAGDSFMIRRYEEMKDGYLLQAENKKISPLHIGTGNDQVKFLGVVIFVIKSV